MRKSRAVVVGTNAYPFLIRFWYELFLRYWQDEVDKVYIAVSNPEHMSAWGYTQKMLSQHEKVEVIHTGINWPNSLNQVAKIAIENYDTVWFPHDDTFVFKKGILDKYFSLAEEENAVITTIHPIFRPKDTIEELMKRKWPDKVPFVCEDGRSEYSFYCNMFFAPSEFMRKTSIDFGPYIVPVGQYCPLLDWTPLTKEFGSDTNFKLCLELLENNAKFIAIPTYEPTNLIHHQNPIGELMRMEKEGEGIFGDAGWLHLQTMAYHIYGLYWDYGVREALEQQSGGKVGRLIERHEAEKQNSVFVWDIAFKIALIYEFMDITDYSGMSRYFNHAKKELEFAINFLGIERRHIRAIKKIYHNLFLERNK